jgi:DNA polymerase IV
MLMVHIDADGFFASVEQSLNPALRGCPVVTGAERGIIAAASYEAKALGIGRGMQLHVARGLCRDLVVLPSDYESYSIYSQRIFNILRKFIPLIEEYSIDEAFAEIAEDGCATETPEMLARNIRACIRRELGLTVSVGISLTKTLAKLGSKFRKPDGQTILRQEHIPIMLERTSVDKIWGIGKAATAKLQNRGVCTALDFTAMPENEVLRLLHKPGYEIWHELQGRKRFSLESNPLRTYDSMMKGHTFAPPSSNSDFIFAEAADNLERALARLRRHRHLAREIGLCLRLKDYRHQSGSLRTTHAAADDRTFMPLLRYLFTALFQKETTYRSTTVWLAELQPPGLRQNELFEPFQLREEYSRLYTAVDRLNRRFGSHTVKSGALLTLDEKPEHVRDVRPERYKISLPGESSTRHLNIPRMTI